MCTLSILPLDDGLVVAMNRDEANTRPLGGGLARGRAGEAEIAHPVDVSAGGTWFGVSAAGFLVAVLNNYQADDPLAERSLSRGRVPLLALAGGDAARAREVVRALPLDQYRPFRAIVVDPPRGVFFAESDGARLRAVEHAWGPRIFVSSGRTEPEVRVHREARFRALLETEGAAPRAHEALRRLHFQREPARPELGFSMWRPEARSVSYTELRVRGGRWELRHLEAPPVDYEAQRDALEAAPLILRER